MTSKVLTKYSEVRTDKLTGQSIILVEGREQRPTDLINTDSKDNDQNAALNVKKCVFCSGNEDKTPKEIWRKPFASSTENWEIRVIPNMFPALLIEGTSKSDEKHSLDNNRIIDAKGAHEVIVATPNHNDTFATISDKQMDLILEVIVERQNDLYYNLAGVENIKTWINWGKAAGASLRHPHVQLLCLPVNPELDLIYRAYKFNEERRETIMDSQIKKAIEDELTFFENDDFIALCPFASIQPYMMRIFPKILVPSLKYLEPNNRFMLAATLNQCFKRLENVFRFLPPLNTVFHEIPYTWSDSKNKFKFWIDIIPAINKLAGFELATGYSYFINSKPPDKAAKELREIKI